MKLDWERVRLLIWLRKCQARHAMARHGRGWGAAWQQILTFAFAALAFTGCLAAGYFLLNSGEVITLLAWDFWAAVVCYLWLLSLAAEAQRADPIDTGRLLHLPVSLREAFVINFTASLYNMPNVIGLAGAVGLAGGHALHQPLAIAALPAAILFLLMVSAWAQVLRSWFLKVFRNPRRRRWLSIVAGLILALAGQLPNLVNLLNVQLNAPSFGTSAAGGEDEEYDPAWASLPPGAVLDSDNLVESSESESPRIYEMPGRRDIYRLTYTRTLSTAEDSYPPGTVIWRANYWEIRDGVWRRAASPPPGLSKDKFEFPGHIHSRHDHHVRATEDLDGVPADIRDLWPVEELYKPKFFSGIKKLGKATFNWHAAVPPGWPAWIAVSSAFGQPVIPIFAGVAGFILLIALGLRRAWRIQCAAVLMTEKPPRPGSANPAAAAVARWSPASDKSATLVRPMALCAPLVSGLGRAFLRQWARSVEIRFQIIVACGLAGGAVGFGLFLWWTDRSTAGAFHVVSSIVGLTILAFMGLFINFFGYDRSACRAMILAPVSARDVLMAKNAAIARLVLFTSLPFVAASAVISGEWLMSVLAWVLLAPAAILLCLALGNSASPANPTPIRLGQRTQARPDAGFGNGCLHLILYFGIMVILQIPQILVGVSGLPWAGVIAACAVLTGAFMIWRGNFENQARRLEVKFPDVADAVGKATDM